MFKVNKLSRCMEFDVKILFFVFALFLQARLFSFSFTDDLGREVFVENPKSVAALQGSLGSLWLLAGGKLSGATSDCFSEPPAMTKSQADNENAKWKTSGFRMHGEGIFSYFGADYSHTKNVGAMMSPNVELLIALKTDFVILSAKQGTHKKIESTLNKAGIECAFFDYDGFDSFLRIFKIFCSILHNESRFDEIGNAQAKKIDEIVQKKSGSGKSVRTASN